MLARQGLDLDHSTGRKHEVIGSMCIEINKKRALEIHERATDSWRERFLMIYFPYTT